MWVFKKIVNEYHVGYFVNEQRSDNGRPESRFSSQIPFPDLIGAVRMVHYLNGGESELALEALRAQVRRQRHLTLQVEQGLKAVAQEMEEERKSV